MISALQIAKALGGRRVGNSWIARCPAHDDNTPSLSIRDANNGTVLVRCHAGCEQTDVIAALRSRGLSLEKESSRSTYSYRVLGADDRRRGNGDKRSKQASQDVLRMIDQIMAQASLRK